MFTDEQAQTVLRGIDRDVTLAMPTMLEVAAAQTALREALERMRPLVELYRESQIDDFDRAAELLRFFDEHVRSHEAEFMHRAALIFTDEQIADAQKWSRENVRKHIQRLRKEGSCNVDPPSREETRRRTRTRLA